jgi:hypothetical protein
MNGFHSRQRTGLIHVVPHKKNNPQYKRKLNSHCINFIAPVGEKQHSMATKGFIFNN